MTGSGGGAGRRRPPGARLALTATVAFLSVIAGPVPRPAAASHASTRQPGPELADAVLISAEGADPVLDDIDVETTPAVRRSEDRLVDAQLVQAGAAGLLAEAQQARAELLDKALSAATAAADAQGALDRADEEVRRRKEAQIARQKVTDRRRKELDAEQALLRELAVAMFTSKPQDELAGLGTFDQMSTGFRRDAVRGIVADDQSSVVDAAERRWRTARRASQAEQRRVAQAESARQARAADLAEAVRIRDDLDLLLRGADRRVTEQQGALDRADEARRDALIDRRIARLTADVVGADLTLVSLHAYWRAAAVAPCEIPWWVLAGVGRVETHHGTAQGSTVGPDGTTSVRILGIPLDGRPGVAAVGDSDGGRFDGTATVDRAVGPMQFIPSTWVRWASDANGDEVSDPHNLYDAAGAAANYLCFGRGPLLEDAALRQALLSYNRSVPYGTAVLGHAHGYEEALDLPGIPPPEAGRTLEELRSGEPPT